MRLSLLLLIVVALQFTTSYPVEEEESTGPEQQPLVPEVRKIKSSSFSRKTRTQPKHRGKPLNSVKQKNSNVAIPHRNPAKDRGKVDKVRNNDLTETKWNRYPKNKGQTDATRLNKDKNSLKTPKRKNKTQKDISKTAPAEIKNEKQVASKGRKGRKNRNNKTENVKERSRREKKEERRKKRREAKIRRRNEEIERRKKDKALQSRRDPKYEEKKKHSDALKFSSLSQKDEAATKKSKARKFVDFLAQKFNSTVDKLKPMLSDLKNKTMSLLKNTDFKYSCKCEDKVCECCAKFLVKVCFTAAYQRIEEKSIVTLKVAARVGCEVPIYSGVLHFNRKAPACTDIGSPIGRVCIKGKKSELKKQKGSGTDVEIGIKILFDDFLKGINVTLKWQNGMLESKDFEIIDYVPKAVDEKISKSSEESKESNESKEHIEKERQQHKHYRVRLKVDKKYKMKLDDTKPPRKWKGVLDPIALGLRRAKDGKCECKDEKCECCVNLGTYQACITAVYTPLTEGLGIDDSVLDEESVESGENNTDGNESIGNGSSETSKEHSGENAEADEEDEVVSDENSEIGGIDPTITIIGSFKRANEDKALASVSYTAIGHTEDEKECEAKQRFGNLCLKVDTVYLGEEDKTKGVCFSFIMNEYTFGFKKCIALEDDETLTIGDPQ